jgi:hypothetical protein
LRVIFSPAQRKRGKMQRFSHREFYEMVRVYILSGENLNEARRMYEAESVPRLIAQSLPYPVVPNQRTILRANQRLLDHGQFTTPSHAHGGGAPRLVVELEDEIFDFFERHPRASTRDAARRFNITHTSVWHLLHSAGMHPYKFQKVQQLNEADAQNRRDFCTWLIQNADKNILWTDESMFTRVGMYNCHNEHWWSYSNPHAIREHHHQARFSVNVWAGILGDKILGPYFIEGHLTGGTYLEMLQGVISEFLEDVPLVYLQDFYFQQDGAPPHYAQQVRQYLNATYGDRWIGRAGPVPWPARSPDLTPCDFYLWGEIKRLVYENEIESRDVLMARIRSAFDTVRSDSAVLSRVRRNAVKRARLCLERNGLHFEQLLKYT